MKRVPGWWMAAGAGLVALMFFVDPLTAWFLPRCPLNALTGLYCPGCGSTRALHALAHGDVGAALRFNLLAVAALPVLGVAVLVRWAVWERPSGRDQEAQLAAGSLPAVGGAFGDQGPLPRPQRTAWGWALVAVVILFGILRNIPLEICQVLRP